MKKVLCLLFSFCAFFLARHSVLAEQAYIYLGDPIPGIRLHLKTPSVEKDKLMYEIINRNTGEYVYCIEPGVILHDGYFTAYQTLDGLNINLTEEDWNQLKVITYFGYGYQDRKELKWYAATQFLVWEYLLKDTGEIYFIDEDGNLDDPLKEEIDAIRRDVKRFGVLPSFYEDSNKLVFNTEMNEEIILEDQNGVLQNYDLAYTPYASVLGNQVTISIPYPGQYFFFFTYHTDTYANSKIYYSPSSQTVMSRGILKLPTSSIEVNVDFPTFKFVKESSEDVSLSLEGAVYELHYEDGSLYTTFTTDENGEFFMEEIYQGKYYLEEIEAPYGYHINHDKIYFEVTDQDVVVRDTDFVIKKEVVIEKYLENMDGKLELEDSAVFQVIDRKTNELVTTFETNQYGKYQLSLPYGDYVIKQIRSTEGYQLHEDVSFTINENTQDEPIILKNPEIQGSLIVFKKDLDTKELIKDEACFRIRNVFQDKFVSIDGVDVFETKDGVLKIDGLPYGEYELVEVKAPYGYLASKDPYFFSIHDMGEEVEVEVYNSLDKREIIIEKYLEYASGDVMPEADAVFQIVDQKTNEVVFTFQTDQQGQFFLDLPLGEYILRQLASKEGFLLSEDLSFSINENTNQDIISVYNKQIVGSLKLEKKDGDTKEFIMDSAIFQIINRDTKEYLNINGETEFQTKEGILYLFPIPYGNYELVEVKAPYGYKLLLESISFSITSIDEVVELEVFNFCNVGSFLLQKLDYDHLEPLEGVLFGLYDENKNLIGEYETNKKGEIFIENLLSGIYYLKEFSTIPGYELLDGLMDIEIKPHVLSTAKITNRLKIEVPKTGVNEFLFTILFSALSLFIGAFICNYDQED